MQYDPVKRKLGALFNTTPFLRKLFYRLLDLLLLRSWHVHSELRSWISKHRNSAAYILDAGAGFGQYTYWLSGLGRKWRIKAIDVKTEQVADCNQFFKRIGRDERVNFVVDDLVTYREPDTFDLVVCVDVMEHILEDEQVLANYAASLKTGGMLIISTPSDQGGSDVHGDEEESFIEEHVRDGYNIEDMKAKLLRNGFSKAEPRYSYGAPGKISWRLSMKYPLLMLQATKLFYIVLPFYYLVTYPISFVLNWLDVQQKHATGTGLIVRAWK
jgi:SAM-dependent methyltransferase